MTQPVEFNEEQLAALELNETIAEKLGAPPNPYKNRRCTIYGQPGKVRRTFWSETAGWKVCVVGLDNGAKIHYPALKDITFEEK